MIAAILASPLAAAAQVLGPPDPAIPADSPPPSIDAASAFTPFALTPQLLAGLGAVGLVLIGVMWRQVRRSIVPFNFSYDAERLTQAPTDELPPSCFIEPPCPTTTVCDLRRKSRPAAGCGRRAAKRAPRVPIADVVTDLMSAAAHACPRDLSDVVCVPSDAVFPGDREDLEEMLGKLLESAHRWARSRVSISATAQDDWLTIVVEDDGPPIELPRDHGIPAAASEAPINCGFRHGLGFVATRKIAAHYNGTLTLANIRPRGTQAILVFPLVATW